MKKLIYFVIVIFFLNGIKSHAQQINLADFIKNNAYKREKIYVHFDKNAYQPGDTLWFKAYLFADSKRSVISKNFYFELLSSKGILIDHITAPIYESSSSGFVVLPTDSSTTSLYCRAYTVAMLNGDTGLIYKKALPINKPIINHLTAYPPVPLIRFLPEGGNWVNGLPSVMAFKATDTAGYPLFANGVIKDNNNNIVTDFKTTHDGMGSFTIMPEKNKSYSALWKSSGGKEYITKLPPPREQGINMQVSNITNGKRVMLFRSNIIDETDNKVTLIGVINSTVIYQSQVDLSKQTSCNIFIPTQGLPSGILYITLFNSKMMPVSERVTFINNENYNFKVNPSFIQVSKEKRGLNKVTLVKNDSIRANLSLSVTDATINPSNDNEDNIITHLLLTGDLRGKVLKPFYYFLNKNDSTIKNLDLVMLTNGWRKYNWTINPAPENLLKESNFLNINGKLKDFNLKDLTADPRMNVILSPSDSVATLIDFPLSNDGSFFKDGIIFYGTANFFIKFKKKDFIVKPAQITIQNGLLKSYEFKSFDTLSYTWNMAPLFAYMSKQREDAFIKNSNVKGKVLNEVLIKFRTDTKLEILDKKYTNGFFKGGISRNIDLGSDPKSIRYLSLFQYLQMNVPGLNIKAPTSGNPSIMWQGSPVAFYLNNIQSNTIDIRSIAMEEFDYIKIYNPAQGGIFRSEGGTISVYTKQGKGLNPSLNEGIKIQLEGYTLNKEFYSPEYTEISPNSIPDFRSTLLWKPNIIIDENTHKIDLHFYNNNTTKQFRIIIEGINLNGKLFHEEMVL